MEPRIMAKIASLELWRDDYEAQRGSGGSDLTWEERYPAWARELALLKRGEKRPPDDVTPATLVALGVVASVLWLLIAILYLTPFGAWE